MTQRSEVKKKTDTYYHAHGKSFSGWRKPDPASGIAWLIGIGLWVTAILAMIYDALLT